MSVTDEDPRDRPMYGGGTWGEYVADRGLEWDPALARFARDPSDLVKMIREKGAKSPPPLPVYDGPPPATMDEATALIDGIGREWSALDEGATAAIVHLRGKADRLTDEEGPAVLEDQAEPETSEASAPPARKAQPPMKPTGEGLPISLWGDVTLKVYPEVRGTYPIEILRGETRICIEAPKSPPWLSSKLQDALITGLTAAVEDEGRSREFVKRKVGEAFATIAERLETDDETRRALTPAPVRRIIEETESVVVYPGEATFYEVTIRCRTLTITAAQMARVESGFINAAVLNAFPLDPLDASKGDWKAIKDYWLSPDVAEVRDREETSEAEIVIERLRAHCEGLTLVASAEALTADTLAWNDEADRLVWIIGTRIARFIEEELKKPPEYSAALSKILRAEGGPMPRPTKPIRIGPSSKLVRCWGLKEDFARFKSPVGGMRVRDAVTVRKEDQ